ncbi:hypothetical protein HS125_18240 [bacterium]|nr:hypothetical protein [bacterium]
MNACRLLILLSVLSWAPPTFAADRVAVPAPGDLPAPARFGLSELEKALTAQGLVASTAAQRPVLTVKVEKGQGAAGLSVPEAPESYAIKVAGKTATVAGRDAVGLMYGLLDLADQVRLADASGTPAEQLTSRARQPHLRIRAVNQFLFTDALEDPDSWFFDERFWRDYFAMLARTRHNLLDLHAAYDLESTYFPNIYPYFVTVEGFPDVGATAAQARAGGVPPETAARNLAMFNRILRLGKEYGVSVALMNYNAQTWRGRNARAMGGDELVAYIKAACKQFVAACPDLWMYGFRIGESGQPESFFTDAYVAALKEIDARLNLYTRSWLATKDKITPIAEGFSGDFYIEPKYNGEQLGLPYHAITTPRRWAPSYSYESYTDWPRNYQILYQVRANGTHRIFHWGGYDFVRRCAATGNYADGAGLSIEPMTAYYPIENVYHEPTETPRNYYQWATERDWLWYELWGRLMYDPQTPEALFLEMYRERFGREAGNRLWKATQASSRIVPMIYSYHCLGPDHRNMAPEMEIGAERRGGITGMPAETGDYDDFLTTHPLDGQVMASPVEYVENILGGTPDGRLTPWQVADYLEQAADESQAFLTPLSVSSLSRRGYAAGRLMAGAAYYTDRAYTITAIPERLERAVLIATPNDDKLRRGFTWSFALDHPAEVLVAWDMRNPLPEWMGAFSPSGEAISTSDRDASPYRLFSRKFPAGAVELGAAPNGSSFYFVVVVPEKEGLVAERSTDEFDKIRMDVDAVAALGRYYAARIRAAVRVKLFEETGALTSAPRTFDRRAVAHRHELARIADGHYAPIREHLRMHTQWEGFTWTGREEPGQPDGATMAAGPRLALAAQRRGEPRLGHAPPAS